MVFSVAPLIAISVASNTALMGRRSMIASDRTEDVESLYPMIRTPRTEEQRKYEEEFLKMLEEAMDMRIKMLCKDIKED